MKVCFHEDYLIKWKACVKHSATEPKDFKDSGTKQLVTAVKGSSTYTESMFTAPNSNRFLSTSLGDMLVGS